MKVAYLSYHQVSTYREISVVAHRYSMIVVNEQWNPHCLEYTIGADIPLGNTSICHNLHLQQKLLFWNIVSDGHAKKQSHVRGLFPTNERVHLGAPHKQSDLTSAA